MQSSIAIISISGGFLALNTHQQSEKTHCISPNTDAAVSHATDRLI